MVIQPGPNNRVLVWGDQGHAVLKVAPFLFLQYIAPCCGVTHVAGRAYYET
jgi:hypothetical protein